MKKASIVLGVIAAALVLVVVAVSRQAGGPEVAPGETDAATAAGPHPSFLHGRITTVAGAAYEGRLRFGGGEEAFWGDYFNGFKDENSWAAHVPPEHLKENRPLWILGVKIADREKQIDLGRPFMGRFGDIARIEAGRDDIRVTLKSGTVFELDRFAADDFADGVRIWDGTRGVLDFHETQIRAIDLFPADPVDAAPDRLHGTVRARQGDFTGFVQWNRKECLGTDTLDGYAEDGKVGLRFDTVRSIARNSGNSSLVTLHDGREIVLSGTREAGEGNLGVYVDDRRYGRVLVSWDAFERIDFEPGGGGPTYDEFPPGHPLTGSVTTLAGDRHAGRLVYDLDESETTETLDAPSGGVDYTIPFGLIASVVAPATVTLQSGEELQLERRGDLGEKNFGMLIFVDGSERPEYVRWTDVARIDLDRPPAMYPPLGER